MDGYRVSRRSEEFYGARDLSKMFPPEGSPRTSVPWHEQGRLKTIQDYDKKLVHETLAQPPDLQEFDPRELHATQASVTREGVAYYLGRQFQETGETFADKTNVGNQHPFVYQREGDRNGPQNLILAGHHRAAAALLKGEPLKARTVRGPWGPPR